MLERVFLQFEAEIPILPHILVFRRSFSALTPAQVEVSIYDQILSEPL